ncbi:hypothetical protein B0A48_04319 [Cryoendolithus antarcticus]|uniref:Uncharacterized protein n=1 Tax=Cryoendolithus antarcticus TaxID=1507870 RepID=A0A1V8TFB0_9PEZI|nr:hypothetical protein B0A48_04319 [Cryoendolithus antarcticus]
MRRYISYYGNLNIKSTFDNGPLLIANLLVHTHLNRNPTSATYALGTFYKATLNLVLLFHSCHVLMHDGKAVEAANALALQDSLRTSWQAVENLASIHGAPMNDPEYLRARVQDKTLLDGPHHAVVLGVPKYPITKRMGFQFPACPLYTRNCTEVLLKTLGLPTVGGGFAYCVKSLRMQEMAYAACTYEEPIDTQLMNSPLCQAALLEDMFLF